MPANAEEIETLAKLTLAELESHGLCRVRDDEARRVAVICIEVAIQKGVGIGIDRAADAFNKVRSK